MAFETGVANNHLDLWDKLHTFLTANPELVAAGEAWDVPWQVTTPEGYIDRVYRNRGAGIGRDVLVATRMVSTGLADNNVMYLRGVISIKQSATRYDDHIGGSDYVGTFAQNLPMRYWFVASSRRFVVVYKISTTYQSMYGGLILPFANPVEYPYPLAVGGSFSTSGSGVPEITDWRSVANGHSAFFDPYHYATAGSTNVDSQLKVLGRDSTWGDVAGGRYGTAPGGKYALGPKMALAGTSWGVYPDLYYALGTIGFDNLLSATYELLGGGFAMRPLRVFGTVPYANTNYPSIGDLDGVFYVDGASNAVENIIQVDGVDHLVVQNIFRTGLTNYAAVRLS